MEIAKYDNVKESVIEVEFLDKSKKNMNVSVKRIKNTFNMHLAIEDKIFSYLYIFDEDTMISNDCEYISKCNNQKITNIYSKLNIKEPYVIQLNYNEEVRIIRFNDVSQYEDYSYKTTLHLDKLYLDKNLELQDYMTKYNHANSFGFDNGTAFKDKSCIGFKTEDRLDIAFNLYTQLFFYSSIGNFTQFEELKKGLLEECNCKEDELGMYTEGVNLYILSNRNDLPIARRRDEKIHHQIRKLINNNLVQVTVEKEEK